MVKNVLVPHGMTSSGYVWNDAFGKNEAIPHNLEGEPQPKGHPTAIDMARYASAGGLITTARDFQSLSSGSLNQKKMIDTGLTGKVSKKCFAHS